MTLVNIDLRNQGYETGPDDRVVFYSLLVREGDFGTISTAPVEVPLVDGKATVDLSPGPVGVQIIAGQIADTRVKIGEVPPSGPTTLGAVMMVTPAYTPALQKMMIAAVERAKEIALTKVDSEVAKAVSGEVGEFKTKAEQALAKSTAAESKSDTALSKSTTAESSAGNAVSRVSALEAMGGLTPESPVDGQNANLIYQPETLTGQALRSELGDTYVRQDDRTVHVKTFGAVGDGLADDTAALQAALDSGKPLYWGDTSDKYRTTAQLRLNANSPVVWRADGATVKCDAPTPVQRVFWVELRGNHLTIDGPLTIDADGKAFSCIYVANANDILVNASISRLEVANPYRASRDFIGGEGIALRGGFQTITLDRPIVRNVHMAAGAGIPGAQGVTGINITALTVQRSPRDVNIIAPFIDGVYDEDTTSNIDQDGIKVFAAEDAAGVAVPFETKFSITGGTIRNCGGRAVKSQTEWGTITGLKIYRGQARTQGGPDIDFQVGGGQVVALSAHYEGNAGSAVVNFSGPATAGKLIPHGSLSGLKIITTGGQVPESLITFNQRSDITSNVTVQDVEVIGVQPMYVLSMNGVSGGKHSAILSGVFAAPTTALVRGGFGSPNGWTGDLAVSNCVNTGNAPVPVFRSLSGELAAPTRHVTNAVRFSNS